MTTIDLTGTDHLSFVHDARTYIDQDTFDLAIEHWRIVEDRVDTDSIYDGSEDVTYALAWVSGDSARVTIIQFDEEAGGYPIDGLPFFLDIEPAEPEPPRPTTQHFFVTITGATSEIYPADLRAGIHGSMFRDDTVVAITKGATD